MMRNFNQSNFVSPYLDGPDFHFSDALPADLDTLLAPLIERLRECDQRRLILEREGGSQRSLKKMTEVLSGEIVLGDSEPYRVALIDPERVKRAVTALHRDLHLEVRLRPTMMPVYYLCRTRWDYWSEYGLIVEDYHVSPGYPFHDERLVKLMRFGHEVYYLRLAPFRRAASQLMDRRSGLRTVAQMTDEMLYRAGRYVFQFMWHEDQKPALAACNAFALKRFGQAMELLYLCLGAELCDLRGALTEELLQFFSHAYPQPAVHVLLTMLKNADGAMLASLPQRALPLYKRLSASFSRFLKQEVVWGNRKTTLPLFKILFGNLSRLDAVRSMLIDNSQVNAARDVLERQSGMIIAEIIATAGTHPLPHYPPVA